MQNLFEKKKFRIFLNQSDNDYFVSLQRRKKAVFVTYLRNHKIKKVYYFAKKNRPKILKYSI